MKYNYIDLFAGAGGLSEGFTRAGFTPIAHVEMDQAACYSLQTRAVFHYLNEQHRKKEYTAYLEGKINREQLYNLVIPEQVHDSIINCAIGAENNEKIHRRIKRLLGDRKVDLIIGGPPCQAYSLVGRARSKSGMEGDPRNFLYIEYAKYLEKYQPSIFVFENVTGLKSAKGGSYLTDMEKLFLKKGYNIKLFTVEARKFGVLQNRKRIVIIGWRGDLEITIPDLEKINVATPYTVSEVFADLPFLYAGEGQDKNQTYTIDTPSKYLKENYLRNGQKVLTQHVARPHTDQDLEIYRIAVKKWNRKQERLDYNDLPNHLKSHNNRHSFFDRFKVVARDLPYSQTIVAHISKDGHYYIHPDIEQNRSLTVREAARLQSFPDDYYFEGVKEGANRTAAFKQIGNAVPPLMAEKIALLLKPLLK